MKKSSLILLYPSIHPACLLSFAHGAVGCCHLITISFWGSSSSFYHPKQALHQSRNYCYCFALASQLLLPWLLQYFYSYGSNYLITPLLAAPYTILCPMVCCAMLRQYIYCIWEMLSCLCAHIDDFQLPKLTEKKLYSAIAKVFGRIVVMVCLRRKNHAPHELDYTCLLVLLKLPTLHCNHNSKSMNMEHSTYLRPTDLVESLFLHTRGGC